MEKLHIKINEKTVGIARIKNGVAQLLLDTSKYSLKDYIIKAIYGGNEINAKANAISTLTIIKYDTEVKVDDVVVNNGANATLTVMKTTLKIQLENNKLVRSEDLKLNIKIVDDNNNNVIGTTAIAVKLNGRTMTTCNIIDGMAEIAFNFDEYRNSNYNLTIVAGANKLYNSASMTSVLTIV